jgi:hypothetical protein
MVDIDKILTAAIRQVDCPELSWHHRIEVEIIQCVRAALEREGIIVTPSRPMPDAVAVAPSRQAPTLVPVA